VRPRTKVKQPDERPDYYSTVGLLPGESSAGFEEVRKNLIAEFATDGPSKWVTSRIWRSSSGANKIFQHFVGRWVIPHCISTRAPRPGLGPRD
jgi:hypothetical protein